MKCQHYSDPTFGRLTNLLMGLAMCLLMSTAMACPLLADNFEYQAYEQLNILRLLVVLTIEADPVCA